MSSKIIELVARTAAFLALLAPVFFALERLWPKAPAAPRLTWRAWGEDVAWLLLGAATLTFVVGPLLRLVAPAPAQSPSAWRLLGAFAGAELMAYASHRAMHEVPWLWRFHALHHAPVELDWMKAWRQHPVDVAVHAVCVAVPGLVLGAPLSALPWLVLLRRAYTAFLHANVDVRLGWLEHVVASPAFHHRHHAHEPRLFDANYAGLFPWLDRLFGTWRV